MEGRYQQDPKGDHLTLCFKDQEQVVKSTHTASHGYVDDRKTSVLREATHSGEKLDSTIVGSGRQAWPSEAQIELEIAYGHLPDVNQIAPGDDTN